MSKIVANTKEAVSGFQIQDLQDLQELVCKAFNLTLADGTAEEIELFNTCIAHGGTVTDWTEWISEYQLAEKAALFYLMDDCHMDVMDAMQHLSDVTVYACSLEEAAREIFDDCHQHELPEKWQAYFDYEQWANDLRLGGDLREFSFNGHTWTVSDSR